MKNAHLRMGTLTFMRQTRDTVTNVSVHLSHLVAEPPGDSRLATQLHFASAFGGDQDIGALAAAAQEALRLQVALPGMPSFLGTLGEKPTINRASLPIPGRRHPLRHVVILSREYSETAQTTASEAERTILFQGDPDFVLYRLAIRFGLPVLPEWSPWLRDELVRRDCLDDLLGFNCTPIAVTGTRLTLLRILSEGLCRHGIQIPDQAAREGRKVREM